MTNGEKRQNECGILHQKMNLLQRFKNRETKKTLRRDKELLMRELRKLYKTKSYSYQLQQVPVVEMARSREIPSDYSIDESVVINNLAYDFVDSIKDYMSVDKKIDSSTGKVVYYAKIKLVDWDDKKISIRRMDKCRY